MKTQGFERRFSQNLAPVGARKAPKPLLCLHFKFIQQTLTKTYLNKSPQKTSLSRGLITIDGKQTYGDVNLQLPQERY